MDKQFDKLTSRPGLTWRNEFIDTKKPSITINCDEIALRCRGIEIVFGEKDFSQYEYIEINGVKFKQEKN